MSSAFRQLELQALTPEQLAARVEGVTLAEARKIVAGIHRDQPVAPSGAVRRSAAAAVAAAGYVPTLEVTAEVASSVDPFVKYQLVTADNHAVECVRIPLENAQRVTACVSSQVGCALACAFCATGRLGLSRNLAAWEIVEQVRIIRRRLPTTTRVHGVVFQGMGEPMANLDNVLSAIGVLSDPCGLGIDARCITVSTAGLPSGIRRLAMAAPNVRLALSLGSARPEVRRRVMPIENSHSLDDVLDAACEHARHTGLSPMWAITLLQGVNDSEQDAYALASLAQSFAHKSGRRPRLSIIPYNAIGPHDPFARSSETAERRFRAILAAAGLAHHKRYSGGQDVAAGCGQLVGSAQSDRGIARSR